MQTKHDKKEGTMIRVSIQTRDRLNEIRKKERLASADAVIEKFIERYEEKR